MPGGVACLAMGREASLAAAVLRQRRGDAGQHRGHQPPSPPQKQEFAMKKFVLAAIAALSFGIGSAYAAQTLTCSRP